MISTSSKMRDTPIKKIEKITQVKDRLTHKNELEQVVPDICGD